MISEDYILAPNIDCALKHAHLKHNKNGKVIDKINIKIKEDLVWNKCYVSNETMFQTSLDSKCPNIYLNDDISINGPIYLRDSSHNIYFGKISVEGSGTFIWGTAGEGNPNEVTFNKVFFNIDKNANGIDIFSIENNKLTFNESVINITNAPNIIRGGSNSVVTIKDSSLNINNIPSGGIGITSNSVNLENNHFIELSNNKQMFYDVNNLTISNNNEFNYLDNSVGISAKQINFKSNKQISFHNNDAGIQSDIVNLEDNNFLEFMNNKIAFNDVSNLTISNSEINITKTLNIIKGRTNSVVTIKDSSLNINNIPSDGKGIQSDIVNLEGNHLLEFNNNNTVFTDVSNLTISNNNQFNYLDNSVGILAKQINIISNKQMSFNENNPNFTLINATTGTIDISNSNLLFYKNIISGTSYGTLLWAPTDIIFDGGSLVALNNSTPLYFIVLFN
jgi:hypothetical protein